MFTRIVCTSEDTAAVSNFLESHTQTSLFLLGNLSAKAIDDAAARYVMTKDDAVVAGVVSVTAAGFVLVQAPEDAAQLVSFAVQSAGTPIKGLIGPTTQITNVLQGLSLQLVPTRLHSDERIYERELRQFSADVSPDVEVRLAGPFDVDAVTRLRRAYLIEAVGATDTPETDATARAEAERMCRDEATFVLVDGGKIVTMTAFSARHGKVVQVGGVFTPVELRRRGHARTVVAGSLLHAIRVWGAERAILFTAEANVAAQRTYEGLGFRRNGEYTLHFFREPLSVAEAASLMQPANGRPLETGAR